MITITPAERREDALWTARAMLRAARTSRMIGTRPATAGYLRDAATWRREAARSAR